MEEIKVSISCITYNHEKYIRQCLDSLLMQKTNFKYEIIVHDDASTDNTANIIREYKKKYPDVIKPIYQSENQYSKGIRIGSTYIADKIQGKYVAFCEGDDFWTDSCKLQKQFDIMERNPDCSICVHKVVDVSENGACLNKFHPNFDLVEEKFDLKFFVEKILKKTGYPFQTTSYFIRTDVKRDYDYNSPEFVNKFVVGDVPLVLFSLTKGKMFYINECMSSYRTLSEGSWSSKRIGSGSAKISSFINAANGYESFNAYTNYIYDESIKNYICVAKSSAALLMEDYRSCLKKNYRNCFNKKELALIVLKYIISLFKDIKSIFSKS